MDRLFDQMCRGMWRGVHTDYGRHDSGVRLDRTDEGYVVIADLPGFETEEIDLRFDDGVLTIDAVHDVEDDAGIRSRRVHEELTVPGEVSLEDIEADYHNGVLEIRLPLEEDDDSGGYRIEIDE